MELWAAFDNYCERVDASYWSEPINAISNAAFLIAAAFCWAVIRERDFGARLLTVILALIGIGSYLFHTHANGISLLADVIPIQMFILVYLYFATTRFFAWPWFAGIGAVVGFFPFAIGIGSLISEAFGPLNGSVGYIPVAVLITAYGLVLLRKARGTGIGLLIGAGLLSLSLFFRTIDEAICPGFPAGTHFLWHLLNGLMLGWMIIVLHRAALPLARGKSAR